MFDFQFHLLSYSWKPKLSPYLKCFSGRVVSGECQGEMMDYRRMLMEDFSLSPEIVLHCRSEIEGHCSGLHRKGRTLHCLMRVGRGDMGAIDTNCQKAVSLQPCFIYMNHPVTSEQSEPFQVTEAPPPHV